MRMSIISAILLGGIFYWFQLPENNTSDMTLINIDSEVLASSPVPFDDTSVTFDNKTDLESITNVLTKQPFNKEESISQNAALQQLTQLANIKLSLIKPHIIKFWQQCKQQNNCQQQLNQLEKISKIQRFRLVAEYPEKIQQVNQLMGSVIISQDIQLSDKIDQVKSLRAEVWGESAEALFAEENAIYASQIALANLYQESQYLSTEESLNNLDIWQQQQGENYTPEQQYQQALQLLNHDKSEAEQRQLSAILAKKYLGEAHSKAVIERSEQVEQQQQLISDYQTGLTELIAQLNDEKNSLQNQLSAQQWQTYETDKITQYRQSFFANK